MAKQRRKAKYEATLIYMDEPQLIALTAGKAPVLAVAVPDEDQSVARFLAVTLSPTNWESYLEGNTDLRFLFTYPRTRLLYYFDLMKLKNNEVWLEPAGEHVPEEHLPLARLFSSEHTEEYELPARPNDEEKIIIDGEWDMSEFGAFYQKYADIYAFIASTSNWHNPSCADSEKKRIATTFRTKPFEGGSSYVHFYRGLSSGLSRRQRPALESIQYNSPGKVKIKGIDDIFSNVEFLIKNYLENRKEIIKIYGDLHSYLSKGKYLKLSGNSYDVHDPSSRYINHKSNQLSAALGKIDYGSVYELCNRNPLVCAKIILSLCRRIEDAAEYFAQGRMSYI